MKDDANTPVQEPKTGRTDSILCDEQRAYYFSSEKAEPENSGSTAEKQ